MWNCGNPSTVYYFLIYGYVFQWETLNSTSMSIFFVHVLLLNSKIKYRTCYHSPLSKRINWVLLFGSFYPSQEFYLTPTKCFVQLIFRISFKHFHGVFSVKRLTSIYWCIFHSSCLRIIFFYGTISDTLSRNIHSIYVKSNIKTCGKNSLALFTVISQNDLYHWTHGFFTLPQNYAVINANRNKSAGGGREL